MAESTQNNGESTCMRLTTRCLCVHPSKTLIDEHHVTEYLELGPLGPIQEVPAGLLALGGVSENEPHRFELERFHREMEGSLAAFLLQGEQTRCQHS